MPSPGAAQVTISLGVATRDEAYPTLDRLLLRDDQALYQAKTRGCNQVQVWCEGG